MASSNSPAQELQRIASELHNRAQTFQLLAASPGLEVRLARDAVANDGKALEAMSKAIEAIADTLK